jgi:hypothetical protein
MTNKSKSWSPSPPHWHQRRQPLRSRSIQISEPAMSCRSAIRRLSRGPRRQSVIRESYAIAEVWAPSLWSPVSSNRRMTRPLPAVVALATMRTSTTTKAHCKTAERSALSQNVPAGYRNREFTDASDREIRSHQH